MLDNLLRPGFEVPLHRSLTEPILLGGAPRSVAILNGTLAASSASACGCGSPASLLWLAGHALAVLGARKPTRPSSPVLVPPPRHKGAAHDAEPCRIPEAADRLAD